MFATHPPTTVEYNETFMEDATVIHRCFWCAVQVRESQLETCDDCQEGVRQMDEYVKYEADNEAKHALQYESPDEEPEVIIKRATKSRRIVIDLTESDDESNSCCVHCRASGSPTRTLVNTHNQQIHYVIICDDCC